MVTSDLVSFTFQNLKDELLSELGGEYEELVLGFLQTPHEYDAFCLHNAIRSKDYFVDTVITILATRSAKVINNILTSGSGGGGPGPPPDPQIWRPQLYNLEAQCTIEGLNNKF